MKRNLLIFFFILLMAVAVSFTLLLLPLLRKDNSYEKGSDNITLRVMISPYAPMAPFFIAQERNLFDIDVEFVEGEGSQFALEALQSGDVDIVLDTVSAKTFNTIAKGLKFKIISAQAPTPRLVLIRKDLWDSGVIKNLPQDLRGKTIRISGEGRATYYTLAMILQSAGMDIEKDVVTKVVRSSEMLTAFESKSIDIFTGGQEPFRTYSLEKELAVEYKFPGEDIDGILVTSEDVLQKNGSAVREFLEGMLEGTAYYYNYLYGNAQQQEELINIVAKYTEIPVEIIRHIDWPRPSRDGKFDVQKLDEIQRYYYDKDFVEKMIDLRGAVDFSYLE